MYKLLTHITYIVIYKANKLLLIKYKVLNT